ncbi:hypothetical protein Brsp07_04712 [Brucella sp. NBRC 14130]|uniref:hypothetical protein n=1 Tax=Brucella sp. NBRC 14130 TaxID=3075483 RepID=UPI0030B6C028
MATYISDRIYSEFLAETKRVLVDEPGIAPMNDFAILLMEKLHIFPVSAVCGDVIAFETVAEREASDAQLADVLDTGAYTVTLLG